MTSVVLTCDCPIGGTHAIACWRPCTVGSKHSVSEKSLSSLLTHAFEVDGVGLSYVVLGT